MTKDQILSEYMDLSKLGKSTKKIFHASMQDFADQETEKYKTLIDQAWYDGYCKANEKELAYDLLQQFKAQVSEKGEEK